MCTEENQPKLTTFHKNVNTEVQQGQESENLMRKGAIAVLLDWFKYLAWALVQMLINGRFNIGFHNHSC